jgi:hypothetical protein
MDDRPAWMKKQKTPAAPNQDHGGFHNDNLGQRPVRPRTKNGKRSQ